MQERERHIAAVRASYARCCRKEDFIDVFYFNLTSNAPETGAMFAETDMLTQDTLVRAGIGHLIDFADGVSGVKSKIEELGRRHDRNHINVRPELYRAWADSLTQAVEECDDAYDQSLQTAWQGVLRNGIEVMMSLY